MRTEIKYVSGTILLALALVEGFVTSGPRPPCEHRGSSSTLRHQALLDPNSFLLLQNVAHHLQQQHPPTSADAAVESVIGTQQYIESLLSTMYTTGIAHGHESSWFGPPDPYLEASKSIAPLSSAAGTPAAVSHTEWPQYVQELFARGVKVLDASQLTPQQYLPGIRGVSTPVELLPQNPNTPSLANTNNDYLAEFEAKAVWSNNFSKVFDKLPLAAFAYCLIEFFFLRPNVDLYKGEIEQESPTTLWADVVATGMVRFVAMGIAALLTLVIFG